MDKQVENVPVGGTRRSVDDPWFALEAGLAAFGPGFVMERDQMPVQTRAGIDAINAEAPAAAP